MKIDIWHNIMWSRYKASVFSQLHDLALASGDHVHVYQIAKTESDRVALGAVDADIHRYSHELMFDCSYSDVPKRHLLLAAARSAWRSKADVAILAGFDRAEYLVQLIVLMVRGRRRAVFCDSTIFDRKQSSWKGLVKRFFFSNVDAVFCYGQRSSAYARSYGARVTIQRYQAAWLPHGYHTESIPELRLRHTPEGGPVFLYVGRLSPEKRIDVLLRAFHDVRLMVPNVKLRIVGKGPCERELEDLSVSLDIQDQVCFVGAKSGEALYEEYLGAHCMVLPSWSEPWGLVVNEALHYGCPVLVSHRCGCAPELVEGSDCGQVFECGDQNDLAARMIDSIPLYEDRRKVAIDCLRKIAPYTPAAAASQILAGAKRISLG